MNQKEEDDNDDDRSFSHRSFPHWDNLYAKEEAVLSLPWYNKDLDDDLREQLSSINMTRGKRFLDLGTGPATQAIELSKLGFQVTATDISENAISRAKSMSEEEDIEFIVDDILNSKLNEDHFDYIFDRGCFHVLEPSSRQRYVNEVSRILRDNGSLFLKTFSTKEPSRYGPYRFSIDDIKSIFSNKFEIVSFKETVYQGTLGVLPKALFIILRKKRLNRSVASNKKPSQYRDPFENLSLANN
ncbi:MAG: class I SAM-dependent methyltransferase [Thermoproteota archaeon]|nr:class I SAM-dependent methyltransferase [Thermoproteota archaeon]